MNPQINTAAFNERPFIAIWKMTQACDLACVHCRASAQPDRDPMELSLEEGKLLVDQIAALQMRSDYRFRSTPDRQHVLRGA